MTQWLKALATTWWLVFKSWDAHVEANNMAEGENWLLLVGPLTFTGALGMCAFLSMGTQVNKCKNILKQYPYIRRSRKLLKRIKINLTLFWFKTFHYSKQRFIFSNNYENNTYLLKTQILTPYFSATISSKFLFSFWACSFILL